MRNGRAHSPEGTKPATSASVQLLRLQTDLRTGSISRDRQGGLGLVANSYMHNTFPYVPLGLYDPPSSAVAEVACSPKSNVWCRLVRATMLVG